MSDYKNTINCIRTNALKGKQQKIVDKNFIISGLFKGMCAESKMEPSIVLLCTVHGLILDFYGAQKEEAISGSILDVSNLSSLCTDLIFYEDIPGYLLITSDERTLIPATKRFINHFKAFIDVIDQYMVQNKYLLSCLDSVKNSISIYDRNANLLFANKNFCRYLHIKDRDTVIGMNIEDIISKAGTRIHSIETNTNHLKMYDVLNKGEEALDWEVRIESAKGDTQIAGNDMYPIIDDMGKIKGLVEITHSRQQSLDHAKKFAGLSAEYTFENIIGSSKVMRESIRTAKDYSNSPLSLLITGESGVGKELFAQSTHNYSSRKNGPFVALNCASFPENLIESELFGYVGGAFTGATKNGQIGKFELADGGTLFLDEIGELPYHFQSKLLRILETWMITRIGGSKPFAVNVRLIAATNRDLSKMVEDGLFRQDLYYRLQILNVNIPPLRERQEDVLLLSEELLLQVKDPNSHMSKKLSEDAKRILFDYDWPGNVRELRNVLYRAALLAKSNTITKEVLESCIFANGSAARARRHSALDSSLSAEARLKQRRLEIDTSNANLLKEAIDISGGKKTKAAALLGMSRNTFYRLLRKYMLD